MDTRRPIQVLILSGLLLGLAAARPGGATAQTAAGAPRPTAAPPTAPMHPTYALLDADGISVLSSGQPVSTLRTCGSCHDTAFIQGHSYHAALGVDRFTAPGQVAGGRAWDTSPGAFGRWDPLLYRYLSPAGDALLDLGTAEWVKLFGARHVGGGPALVARDGRDLGALAPDPANPETAVLDPATGQAQAWDWSDSGTVEMNCFLCHTPNPNNAARTAALRAGAFRWANTATLLGTGLVEPTAGGYHWNAAAFDADGRLKPEYVAVQAPTNANCAQCHEGVHADATTPVSPAEMAGTPWNRLTTGQVIAPQPIADSGINLAGKEGLTRVWDVHAARQLQCTNCHYSLNNPVYVQEGAGSRAEHLTFDPRRLDMGEYLQRPVHDFAKGATAQHALAPELTDTMRRCESCHDAAPSHQWLPYTDRHLATVACETCHIPRLYGPALQAVDWTVLTTAAEPRRELRGVDGDPADARSLVTGYAPVLLSRRDADGSTRLAPYNLVTAWYWVYGAPARPVRLVDLTAAWLDGDHYAPAVLAALDADRDGALAASELVLDTPAKQAVIAARLAARGLANPRITGDVQPYSLSHGVADGEWAIRECRSCHGDNSRLTQPFALASAGPAGVAPALVAGTGTALGGNMIAGAHGGLDYQAVPAQSGLYLFGQSHVGWVDWLGLILLLGTMLAVVLHGGLRLFAALRLPSDTPELRQVYVYTVYERFWHWLQTFTVLGLIFTGLIIHKPEIFGVFAFQSVVQVHNILAAIVIVNASLSLFYHVASGEIRQYVPRPRGFVRRIVAQARFYLSGIFRNAPHPFEKAPERKLNPLQQVTYFGLLNVLLPAQVVTGALMWGAQRWPAAALRLGGLPLLAPAHTLIAWLLASFVVLHVYLITTGHTPLASLQAMMLGWDAVTTPGAPAPSAPVGRGEALAPAQESTHGS
jgi:thiosulfate reductase cytochrome b subunit